MKKWTAAALAALIALTLTGCSFQDVMLYLYGGDSFVTSAEPDYTTCDGDNGVTVVYDQNQWEQPVMAQDDGQPAELHGGAFADHRHLHGFSCPVGAGVGGNDRHGPV